MSSNVHGIGIEASVIVFDRELALMRALLVVFHRTVIFCVYGTLKIFCHYVSFLSKIKNLGIHVISLEIW